jgi:hypothetical protein
MIYALAKQVFSMEWGWVYERNSDLASYPNVFWEPATLIFVQPKTVKAKYGS